MERARLIGLILGIAVGVIIYFLPRELFAGLTVVAQSSLAVIVCAIIWWIFNVINSGAVAVLMMGLLIAVGVKPMVAASGFSVGPFWLLLAVLFYGYAMQKTGLARRFAYWMLGLFEPSYKTLLLSFAIIGIVLPLGIPSLIVRVAIMVPLAWAMVKAMKLPEGHSGSALLTVGAWWMAVVPGVCLLTGTLWGPIYKGFVHPAVVAEQITWGGWFITFSVPVLILTALMGLAIYYLLRPKEPLALSRSFFKEERAKLGVMGRNEKIVLLIVALSVVAWITKPWHGIDEGVVAMVGFGVLFFTKVFEPQDIVTGVPWPLILFIGGILSIMGVFLAGGIHTWIGGFISPLIEPFMGNIFLLVVMLAILVFIIRFLDPTIGITAMALTIPLWTLIMDKGISFLVWGVPLLTATFAFLFPYQVFWYPMGWGMTEMKGWTYPQARKVALAFYPLCLVSLLIGALYWKAIGLV